MTSYKVSPITCPLHLAKGPHWDANTQTLYCVDIFKGTVHSYKPSTCQFSTATVGDGKSAMAVIVPVTGEKDKFLVSMKNDVATISWDGLSEKTSKPEIVASAETADNHNRLNNGKVDPCGRLWAGTTGRRLHPTELEFEEDVGSLYCFEKCGKVSKKLDNITISNGLEWSEDCKKFFYVDSYRYNVMAYDYDNATGNICNGKEIFKTKENCVPGLLDAMTIDTAGRLYIANYVGAQVVVIDSNTGKLVQKIPIPAEEVTSCAFGGPNLDILYVTTGNTNPSAKHPIAGRIFQVTGLGATGYAGRSVVLNDVKVEHVCDIPVTEVRGLSWSANEQALFYVDTASAKIHSYKPSTKSLNSALIAKGEGSSLLLPIIGRKESFLIAQKNALASVKWDRLSASSTSEPEILNAVEKRENTIVSGKVDNHGQIWIGTAPKSLTTNNPDTANNLGNVYQISNNCKEITKQLENVGFPSDFEWSADGMVMYFIDSTKQNVEAFDLNPKTGLIASFTSRNVFNLTDSENVGKMSSLTIDTNDKLYVAVCTVGQILVVNPETCDLINRISIPNNGISSCTFGGINMDILYVITSDSETNSGKLFQVFNLGCQGNPARGALLWDASLKVEHLVGGLSQPRGIRWNENNRSLQFADSAKGTIHNFCPLSRTMTSVTIGNGGSGSELTGLIVPIAGQKDMYAISRGMDLLIAKWDSESSQISTPVILTNLSNYEAFNNGAKNWICSGNVDQKGNLWAGTTGMLPDNLKDNLSHNSGQIYYVQKGHQVVRKIVDLSMPAGFVWSEDGRKFFFVDSLQFTIAVCDYNADSGELSSARELFCLSDHKMHGFICGLTKDTNGMLYAANYFGGQVLVINSITGQLFRTIKIPSSEVIDCTFGGPNMETLFVLTGRSQSKQTGSLYKVTNIGARGYPPTSFVMENSLRTEPVTPALTYGKGAFWDEDEQLLYFCDSSQGTIHSYNPATNRYVTAKVVGAEKSNTNIIIPLEGLRNRFLLGLDNELCTVHWDGKSAETSSPDKSIFVDRKMGIRFNTGKVDSRGRLWAGTTSTEGSDLLLQSGGEGSLYCLDRVRVVEKFTAVAKVSGLEWSSDHKRLFLVDTIKSRVECYDYDERNDSVSNGKIIYKLAELKRGILYSMTIDMNDILYICNNHGSQILMIDSVTGKLLRTLSVPASEILSCAFGGSNLDTLYVTTGNSNPSSEFPHAGRVFAITNLGVRGVSSRKFIVEESIRAEPVTTAFTLATAPHWDPHKQVLYFVARQAATPLFCSYSPSTSKCCFAIVGNGTHTPTMLIPETSQKDAFLVIIRNQLAVVTWDGVSKRTSEPCFIADCDSELQAKRLSVGKVDPQGRLWSGATCNQFETKAQERKVEDLLQNDEKNVSLKWNELAVSTQGLEWSVDGKTFYFVNPKNFEVDSFDFDPSTGIISNRKCVFKMEDHNISGSLDAITIDIDGNLYIANNMGSQILVVNPATGSILSKISIPATEVTGCAFGGTNLDILYVTTGQNCANSRPHAGKLFQVKHLGVKGLPGRSVTL